jgi:hypothetical protein
MPDQPPKRGRGRPRGDDFGKPKRPKAGRPPGAGANKPDAPPPIQFHYPIICALAQSGLSDCDIAELHNLTPSQFGRLRVTNSDLAAALQFGRSKPSELVSRVVYEMALGGNLRAAIFMLTRLGAGDRVTFDA